MYCGVDVGTSSIKCLLVDEDGSRIGLGRASVGLYEGKYGHEADPAEWLKALSQAYAEAASASSLGDSELRERLRAISVSGNGPTLVAVGRDGLPLGRAFSWMDRSATAEAAELSILAGHHVDPSFYLPKALRCLRSAHADNISMFFSGPEYLAFMLGANPVSYLSDDFYDAYVWDSPSVEKLGLNTALFPPYVGPGKRVGFVSPHAAEAIGLPQGLPIVSGFPDFLAALIGSGTVEAGLACDRSGSSEALNVAARKPYPDSSIFSLPHAIEGLWNLSGGLSTSGKALEWFSAVSGYSGLGSDSVFQDAELVEPGSKGLLFLPYLAGERAPLWNTDLRASFWGLSLHHGRRHMARAVVESIAFGLRLASERIKEGGFAIDTIRCSGGAARNGSLCAIKADVLGIGISVPQTPECEPMGGACACAVALGDQPDLKEASKAMVHMGEHYEPNASLRALYDDRYAAWKEALECAIVIAEGGKKRL